MTRWLAWIVAPTLAATPLAAQHHDPSQHNSPYARQEASGIAALSRQEVEDLEAGAGMGLARAAELNHYPGPLHVLQLAAELDLSAEQMADIEAFRASMLADAQRLGGEILELERHLDMRFAHRHIDDQALREATSEIALLQGELRFVHLRAHLLTRAALSEDQVQRYDQLRGYSAAAATP